MDKKFNEIYAKLPTKWEDVTVQDFIKMTAVNVSESDDTGNFFVGADNHIKVMCVLCDTPVEVLESLSLQQVQKLAKKIDFLIDPPPINKTSPLQWKNFNEITYGDYIAFQKLGADFFTNMPVLLPAFSKNQLTVEDVMQMNMADAFTGFFLLTKETKKYLKRTIFYLRVKLVKQVIKEKTVGTLYRMKSMLKGKWNKPNSDGIS